MWPELIMFFKTIDTKLTVYVDDKLHVPEESK